MAWTFETNYWEIWKINMYPIWINNEWWICKPIIDEDWDVINEIQNILENSRESTIIVKVEPDIFTHINSWYINQNKATQEKVQSILLKLYEQNKD